MYVCVAGGGHGTITDERHVSALVHVVEESEESSSGAGEGGGGWDGGGWGVGGEYGWVPRCWERNKALSKQAHGMSVFFSCGLSLLAFTRSLLTWLVSFDVLSLSLSLSLSLALSFSLSLSLHYQSYECYFNWPLLPKTELPSTDPPPSERQQTH